MSSMSEKNPLTKLPVEELLTVLQEFMTPVLAQLPETGCVTWVCWQHAEFWLPIAGVDRDGARKPT